MDLKNKSHKIIANIIILSVIVFSFIFLAYTNGKIGSTIKNGSGCYCHTFSPDTSVKVSISGPASLRPNHQATYTLTITGGPLASGSCNIAVSEGTLLVCDTGLSLYSNELTQSKPRAPSNGKVTFQFLYTAPATPGIQTIYAVGLSADDNGGSGGDLWNNAPLFTVSVADSPGDTLSPFLFPYESAYVNKMSVFRGDTIEFHISTLRSPFQLSIFKYNNTDSLIATINNIMGGERTYSDSSFYYGCNWPVSYSMVIPEDWLPGVYYAQFPTNEGSKSVVFFVKPRAPGSYSKILYLASANTWHAYNPVGGKSFFNYNSINGVRANKVSTQRPGRAYGGFPEFFSELPLIRWLNRNNINIECAVNYDLHSNPVLLNNYNTLVINGHSEYWSYPEKIQAENFIKNGGNIIILSGNTCWWQVRYEDNGNTLVCYENPASDPLKGVIDSLVTTNFRLSPVNSPENTLTGLSFIAGGYVNNEIMLPASDGYGGYSVCNHHSWVYNNTGLMDGDEFGYSEAIVGNAVDGGLFNFINGIPVLSGTDFSPTNFRVLGFSPAYSTWGFTSTPHATMGYFHKPGGGSVFNAATINWSLGLDNNYYVQTITKNVFDKFVSNKLPPDIISWTPYNPVTGFIHHENIPLNKREFLRKDNSSVNFSVTAEDPYGGQVSYQWLINNNPSGSGSTLNVTDYQMSYLNKRNKITALAYNNLDTSAITWNYFNTELALCSDPPESVNLNSRYCYKIYIFNYFNDQITTTFTGPSWLTLNSSGELTGIAPGSTGSFDVSIITANQHAQADTQTFILTVVDPDFPLPVELSSFSGKCRNGNIELTWTTSTELNNAGFEIGRMSRNYKQPGTTGWIKIGYVTGSGNSNSPKNYSYLDKNIPDNGIYSYRIKQIDKDGKYKYSNPITVEVRNIPQSYSLEQNYPNPFNPSTKIKYSLPFESNVRLVVYNAIGESVKELVFQEQKPSYYEVNFDAASTSCGLSSGIYIYSIKAVSSDSKNNFLSVKKMVLMK